ncbi:flagellin N-terminal helical domain-containing protein, partial [Clostridium sardiniense]
MRINTNMNAMTALNSMNKNTNLAGAAMGKISSGLRINKAGDDAAGLAISEKMRSQIRGLDQASRNTQDGVSLIQTAEGATEEIGNITQRMRELSVQASNETNSGSDREKIVEELNQLHSEIDRIADSTQFNGKNLLNGSTKIGDNKTFTTKAGYTIEGLDVSGITAKGDIKLTTKANGADTDITVKTDAGNYTFKATGGAGKLKAGEYTLTSAGKTITFKLDTDAAAALTDENIGETTISDIIGGKVNLQVGANEGQQLLVQINNLGTESLGIAKADIDAIKADNESGCKAAQKMITTLDKALEKVNTSRANFGAMQNRLESAQSNLSTSS